MYDLVSKVIETVKPVVAFLWAGVCFVMFPDKSFEIWCIALWLAAFLDLFTRWFAIFIKSKGIRKAFKSKAWNSEAMFRKTSIKIVAYLVIQILAGLSMRFLSIPFISSAVANVIYAFLFLRELASNIENLIEAGAEGLEPLLFWVKKKGNDTLEKAASTQDTSLNQLIDYENLTESGGDDDDCNR